MTLRSPLVLLAVLLHAVAHAAPLPLVPVATGLDKPVDILPAYDGSGRLFIAEKVGRIRVVKDGVLLPTPLLDIGNLVRVGDETGLLGIVFHPRFATTRFVYVNYSRKSDGANEYARYTVPLATPDVADPASGVVLLTLPQPFANHNGGALRFGRDGYLYIGTGDGGSANDPDNHGQTSTTLLGKLLRIDVDGGAPYAIPPGNMFPGGVGGRAEIWATGLRNPWKFAFDPRDGALWIGDVGQDLREEVDAVPFGTAPPNFGWHVHEGTRCTGLGGGAPCEAPVYTMPVVEYTHADGCSVTGGEIHLGRGLPPAVAGAFLFGDFCTGVVWAATGSFATGFTRTDVGTTGFNITAFGRDEWGESYVADYGGGRVLRIGTAVTAGSVPIVEYYHAGFDHYFISADPAEIAGLDRGAFTGWVRTGLGFRTYADATGGALPICRFYLVPPRDSHFFSADAAECALVEAAAPIAQLESTAALFLKAPDHDTGVCADPQTQPVYRVWNQRADTNHRYTISAAIRDQMVAAGGVAEGYGPDAVAMCAPK